MGLFGKKRKAREQKKAVEKASDKTIANKGVMDLVDSEEKQLMAQALQPLSTEYEQYAEEIVSAFAGYQAYGNNAESFAELKTKIRPIGERINNGDMQRLIAYRAMLIGRSKGIKVYDQELELIWEGIGGWIR